MDDEQEWTRPECVSTYIESGIITLEHVRDRALDVLGELIEWGDAYCAN